MFDNAPPFPLPLLITGIAGVSGYNAFHHFRKRFGENVIGQRPHNNWRLQGPGIVACDMQDRTAVQRLFHKYEFKSVLNCGGSCALKSCELDPAMAQRVNVEGVRCLLQAAANHNLRFVHLSIDLVYSGIGEGNYVETDATDPVTVYGKTMVDAEQLVMSQRPEACILRISLPMGVSFNGHAGAIDWILSRFRQNKPATLYFDEIRTPTYVECLNAVLEIMLSNRIKGLFHCGGPRKMSLYEIAQVVNRIGGYPPELLQGCPRLDAGPMPPRAGNVTMSSQKLLTQIPEIEIAPWPLRDEHVPTHRHWHWDRPTEEMRSLNDLRKNLYLRPMPVTTASKPPKTKELGPKR